MCSLDLIHYCESLSYSIETFQISCNGSSAYVLCDSLLYPRTKNDSLTPWARLMDLGAPGVPSKCTLFRENSDLMMAVFQRSLYSAKPATSSMRRWRSAMYGEVGSSRPRDRAVLESEWSQGTDAFNFLVNLYRTSPAIASGYLICPLTLNIAHTVDYERHRHPRSNLALP